jgi:polysaccharide pyruvyl transferase WcaK-like protein
MVHPDVTVDVRPYYLISFAGVPNYGDDMIAATWIRYLARTTPQIDVWLDCHSPDTAKAVLGHLHPNLRFTDAVWRLCRQVPWEGADQQADFIRGSINTLARVPDLDPVIRAQVVHVIGGGYITRMWPRNVGLLVAASTAAKISGGSAAMTGQGLWPPPDDAGGLYRSLVEEFDVMDVRDERSATLFGSAGNLTCSGDDLFLDFGPDLYRDDGDIRQVMVCMQSDIAEVDLCQLATFLLSTLQRWDVSGGNVGFIECIPESDRAVFTLVRDYFSEARFYSFQDLMDNGMPASQDQRWISTRFHPHLVAAAAGASGVAISVNGDYYCTKHQSLIDLGSGWALAKDLPSAEVPPKGGFAPGVVENLARRKQALARSIYLSPERA